MEMNSYLEAAEKFFDRWEADLKKRRSELDALSRQHDTDRRELREEVESFREEQQRAQNQRERDQQSADQKLREVTRRETELKELEVRLQRESHKIKEREQEIESSHQRLHEERTKFDAEISMKTRELQVERDQVQQEHQELEVQKSAHQNEVNQFNLREQGLVAKEVAFDTKVAEEKQSLQAQQDECDAHKRRLNNESERARARELEIEKQKRDLLEERQQYDLDVKEREDGLAHREALFQNEVAEHEQRMRAAEAEKTRMTAELDQLNQRMRTFQQEEARQTNRLTSWENALNNREVQINSREAILKSNENDYNQREANLRSDLEDLQTNKNKFSDESHAKMTRLNEEEARIREQRIQLDADLAQYNREVIQQNARETEWAEATERRTEALDVKETALKEMAKQQEQESVELVNARNVVENREQALAQSKQEFEAEKQRIQRMATDNKNQKMANDEALQDIHIREERIVAHSNALDHRERQMREHEAVMDAREQNLRQEEAPFEKDKKKLEEREQFLNEREADLGEREDEFRRRVDDAWKEIAQDRIAAEQMRQLYEEKIADVQHQDANFQRMSQTKMEDIGRREENIRQREAELKQRQYELDLAWQAYGKNMESWTHLTEVVKEFADVRPDQQGADQSMSMEVEIRKLGKPHHPPRLSAPSGSGAVEQTEIFPAEDEPNDSEWTGELGKRPVEERDADAEIVEDEPVDASPAHRTRASKARRTTATSTAKKRPRKTATKEDTTEEQSEPSTPKKQRKSRMKEGPLVSWNERRRKPPSGESSSRGV